MAALLALFSINYLVNQVVLGVVLNLLAVGVTGFLFDQLVQPASADVQHRARCWSRSRFPGCRTSRSSARCCSSRTSWPTWRRSRCCWCGWLLFRTTWGLRIRSVGEHPEAADTVGISVRGIRWSAVLAGGVFGGLGGSFFTLASTGSFSKEFTVGNGFIALAALIMGRWHPVLARDDGAVLRLRHPDGVPAADPEHADAEPVPVDPAVRGDDHRRRRTGRPGPTHRPPTASRTRSDHEP